MTGNQSKLLINEPPLQLLPTLAVYIGLNEAIIFQQIHYWLDNPKIGRLDADGNKWVRNSLKEWEQNFPFWKVNTIRRGLDNLCGDELLLWTDSLNKRKKDRTRWYRIDYDLFNLLDSPVARLQKKAGQRLSSLAQVTKMTSCQDGVGQVTDMESTLPETPTETPKDSELPKNGNPPSLLTVQQIAFIVALALAVIRYLNPIALSSSP